METMLEQKETFISNYIIKLKTTSKYLLFQFFYINKNNKITNY